MQRRDLRDFHGNRGTSVFCHSPGSHFIVHDPHYLASVRQRFNELWSDPGLSQKFEETERRVKQWQVPESHYDWAEAEAVLSTKALEAVFDNRIPAIRIQNFATDDECNRFVDALRSVPVGQYELDPSDPKIRMIGHPLYESQGCKDRAEYFAKARESRQVYKAIAHEAGFDPVARFQECLQTRCGIHVGHAKDKQLGEYFAGVIRFVEEELLCHIDFAPLDAVGFGVTKVGHQAAWNLFLTEPKAGGVCTVYSSPWCPIHEKYKEAPSYGYAKALTEGERRFRIRPVRGDVVVFNCRNFHRVEECKGERITVGSFLGRYASGQHVVWS